MCCAQSESDSDCPSRQRCSASRHASLPLHTKRLRGRHGGKAQRAHALFWPMAELPSAPLAEAEELVLESSFPRGLASAECFEARAPGAYLRTRSYRIPLALCLLNASTAVCCLPPVLRPFHWWRFVEDFVCVPARSSMAASTRLHF